MERDVLGGLAMFRWAAWLWMAGSLVVTRDHVARPLLAIGLVGLAFALTAAYTAAWRMRPLTLLRPPAVWLELAMGAALVLADGLAREPGVVFEAGQSLGSVFPIAGILSAGVAWGPAGGAASGTIGVGRIPSALFNGIDTFDTPKVLSLTYTVVFYALAGAVAGYIFMRLSRAEHEVAAARAREEVARTLHDGVLQTLALVERRADDPALARLAREQERELRDYLFGAPSAAIDLAAALRAAAARFEDAFGGRVDVVVPDELPALGVAAVAAVAAATGEALTNAGKHGEARRVVVFVDVDGGEVFCSVKDDGIGADSSAIVEGIGISRSIRGRLEELGGRVALHGAKGTGMEVRMWLPLR